MAMNQLVQLIGAHTGTKLQTIMCRRNWKIACLVIPETLKIQQKHGYDLVQLKSQLWYMYKLLDSHQNQIAKSQTYTVVENPINNLGTNKFPYMCNQRSDNHTDQSLRCLIKSMPSAIYYESNHLHVPCLNTSLKYPSALIEEFIELNQNNHCQDSNGWDSN